MDEQVWTHQEAEECKAPVYATPAARPRATNGVAHAIRISDDPAEVAAVVAMNQPLVAVRGHILPRTQEATALSVHAHDGLALPIAELVPELAL